MAVDGFDAIYASLVERCGGVEVMSPVDVAKCRALATIMADPGADPIRAGQVMAQLQSMLPAPKPVRARPENWDFGRLSDDDVRVLEGLYEKACTPTEAEAAVEAAMRREREEREADRGRSIGGRSIPLN